MRAATVRAVLRAGHALALRDAAAVRRRRNGAAIIDRQDVGNRTQQLGDGATLTVSATMLAFSDASVDLRMTLEVDDGHGNRTRMTPIIPGLQHRAPSIGCPTADGTVTATDSQMADAGDGDRGALRSVAVPLRRQPCQDRHAPPVHGPVRGRPQARDDAHDLGACVPATTGTSGCQRTLHTRFTASAA